MLPPLTKRQREILNYINASLQQNGYAPSLQEIRESFKLKAISTVHEHLENLKNKGYITKEMNQARGIQVREIKKEQEKEIVLVEGVVIKGKITRGSKNIDCIHIDKQLLDEGKEYFCLCIEDEKPSNPKLKYGDLLILERSQEIKDEELFVGSYKNGSLLQEYSKDREINKDQVLGIARILIRRL